MSVNEPRQNATSGYPSSISTDPLAPEPKTSTRQDLPPNNDYQVKRAAQDPDVTSNPVYQKPKAKVGGAAEGVGQGGGEVEGKDGGGGLKDIMKEKVGK